MRSRWMVLLLLPATLAALPFQVASLDSLALRRVGHWSLGPNGPVALDATRNILFLGSGSSLLSLDVSDSMNPVLLSDSLHARGVVHDLLYDPSTARLFVAEGAAGLAIWDFSTPQNPVLLGTYSPPGEIWRLRLQGDTLYAGGSDALRILDVTDPSSPVEIGQFPATYGVRGLDLSGSLAFLAMGSLGMWVLDVSNPASPVPISTFAPDTVRGVAVSGTHAFISAGSMVATTFYVLDVSSPASPSVLDSIPNLTGPYLSHQNNLVGLYGSPYVMFIDVTNPSIPALLGHIAVTGDSSAAVRFTPGRIYVSYARSGLYVLQNGPPAQFQEQSCRTNVFALDWAVSRDLQWAYAATWLNRLDVYTLSNTSVVPVGSVPTPGSPRAVDLDSNLLFMALGDSGIQILDVSSPTSPTVLSRLDVGGFASVIHRVGSYAYVGRLDSSLVVVDVSDPTAPAVVSSIGLDNIVADLASSPNRLYVLYPGNRGLDVLDLTIPTNPGVTGTLQENLGNRMQVQGDTLFVLGSGLMIVDVQDPAHPALLGIERSLPWDAAEIQGNLAYTAYGGTIGTVDLSDPTLPVLTLETYLSPCAASPLVVRISSLYGYIFGQYDVATVTPGQPFHLLGRFLPRSDQAVALAVDSPLVFLGDRQGGLRVLDLSSPARPQLRASLRLDGVPVEIRDLARLGNYLLSAAGNRGIYSVDVSNPLQPAGISRMDVCQGMGSCAVLDLAVDSPLVYVAAGGGGLLTLDLSIPSAPLALSTLTFPGEVTGVTLLPGQHLAVAADTAGVRIVDVSNPASPVETGFVIPPGRAQKVLAAGSLVYVASGDSGIHVLDVSDPTNPVLLASLDTPGEARDLALRDTFLIVADGPGGVRLISVANPTQPVEVGFYDTPGFSNQAAPLSSLLAVADGPAGLLVLGPDTTTGVSGGAFSRTDISISPVVHGQLQILLSRPARQDLHITLWQVNGRRARNFVIPAGKDQLRVPIPYLPSGMYILRVPEMHVSRRVVFLR